MNTKELLQLEKQIKEMLQEIIDSITDSIKNKPNENIKPISSNPVIFTLRLSEIENNIWSPEYYSSIRQAKVIKTALEGTITVTSLINKLQTIIDNKFVITKSSGKVRLNKYTLQILESVYQELTLN